MTNATAPKYKMSNISLLLASHNKGKLEELQNLMGDKVSAIFSALDHDLIEPEETGTTYIENAILKAKDCQAQMQAKGHHNVVTLADDSGFSVEALGGAPGVYSARWAEKEGGSGRDFAYAMQRVHDEWEKQGTDNKNAAFISVIAVCFPDGHIETFEGRIEGQLIWPARGDKGFGYDPMFMPEGYRQSFAEMSFEDKQSMSHRRRALDKMMAALF